MNVVMADTLRFPATEWGSFASPTPFQTSGWYRAWLAAEPEEAEPVIVRTPHAAVALQISDHDGERALRPLGFPWADYHDAVGTAVDALAAALVETKDALRLPLLLHDVVPDGLLDRTMQILGAKVSNASPTGAIDLAVPLPARRELVRKERQLRRLGDLRIVHHRDRADI